MKTTAMIILAPFVLIGFAFGIVTKGFKEGAKYAHWLIRQILDPPGKPAEEMEFEPMKKFIVHHDGVMVTDRSNPTISIVEAYDAGYVRQLGFTGITRIEEVIAEGSKE